MTDEDALPIADLDAPAATVALNRTMRHAGASEIVRRRLGAVRVTHDDHRLDLEPAPGTRRLVGGRARGSEILIDDPSVSAAHFELLLDDRDVVLRDLASTNGTWLDNVRVREVVLSPGSTFRAGNVAVRLERVGEVDVAASTKDRFGELLGSSPAMREMFALLARLAPTPLDVLVGGETGTGKELVARALHEHSARAGHPFCVLDCASLPRELAEAAIRGHVRGAFTGARDDQPSCFEDAAGGTLFLDEVGELPQELQPKLLRVLDRREVQRIGETRTRRVDVRVVAATHRDLRQMVADGKFREDLYHRLAQCTVELPPLRERGDDVVVLAQHFLTAFSIGVEDERGFTADAIAKLREHPWRGNVRELRNTIMRAAQLCGRPTIDRPDLALGSLIVADRRPSARPTTPLPLEAARAAFDRQYFADLLAHTDGNMTEAARVANVTRRGLYKAFERLGMSVR
ncbi:MAG TPA: sigma 54-interacting transcriptional regulator [Nannocystaceae bacterium]|nr:sigma 54-interacting transcriptional regulator [Nannocystaceae bacterium]